MSEFSKPSRIRTPKHVLKRKFRRNLQEFKTKAHSPDNAYKRAKITTNNIESYINDIQS